VCPARSEEFDFDKFVIAVIIPDVIMLHVVWPTGVFLSAKLWKFY